MPGLTPQQLDARRSRWIKRGIEALSRRKSLFLWHLGTGTDRNEDAGWVASLLPREKAEALGDQDEFEAVTGFSEWVDDALKQLAYKEGKRLSQKAADAEEEDEG